MLVTLKNIEIEKLNNALVEIFQSGIKLTNKFGFRASLNLKAVEPIVITINEFKSNNDYIKDFVKYRDILITKLGCKPSIADGKFIFADAEQETQLNNDLSEKYPALDEVVAKFNAECLAMLEQTTDVMLQLVDETDLPNNLNGNLFMALVPMINKDNV